MNPQVITLFEGTRNAKVPTTITLDVEVLEALQEIEDRYKQTRSAVVNRLLTHILLEQKEEKKPIKRGPRGSKTQRAKRNARIIAMREQGYTNAQIAAQMDLSPEYIRQIATNFEKTQKDADE